MAKRTEKAAPPGASVTEDKVVDEAAEMAASTGDKKKKSFADFLAAKREVERKTLKPTSGELEVLTGISDQEVHDLQFPVETSRLVGYEKVKGVHVCFVKTLAFMKKKDDLEKDEK